MFPSPYRPNVRAHPARVAAALSRNRGSSSWTSQASCGVLPGCVFEHVFGRRRVGGHTQAGREDVRGSLSRSVQVRGCPRKSEEVRGSPRKSEEVRGSPRKSAEVRGSLSRSVQVRGSPGKSEEVRGSSCNVRGCPRESDPCGRLGVHAQVPQD